MVADVAHALASLDHVACANRRPRPGSVVAGLSLRAEILACRNGLIHLPSLVAGKHHFTPATPLFFSPNCLDFDFDCRPQPTAWLAFLAELWPDDAQSICTLQEWFGYFLDAATPGNKKSFCLSARNEAARDDCPRLSVA